MSHIIRMGIRVRVLHNSPIQLTLIPFEISKIMRWWRRSVSLVMVATARRIVSIRTVTELTVLRKIWEPVLVNMCSVVTVVAKLFGWLLVVLLLRS